MQKKIINALLNSGISASSFKEHNTQPQLNEIVK
jgi:hypothetical protein